MRSKVIIICGVFLLVCLISSGYLIRGEEQEPQNLLVFDVLVKPYMADKYESAMKEMIAMYPELDWPYTSYAYSTDDFHYYIVYPIKNLTEVDKAGQIWIEMVEKIGPEKWDAMVKQSGKTIKYEKYGMYRHLPALSYAPKNPRVKPEDAPFMYWGMCYVIPGMEKEFEANFKKFVEIFAKHDISSGWDTYAGDMGTEMPFYVYAERGKSPGDFWSHSEEINKKVGEEIMPLWKDTLTYIRKLEYKTGMFRPDLSYIPEK